MASSTERREGHFRGKNGIELFFQSWIPGNPRSTMVITHGISEHSECYAKAAGHLTELGWNVIAWDLRGHGRSEGKRGFVDSFDDYIADLRIFLRFLRDSGRLDQPFALVGHSMGGLITIRHAIDADQNYPSAAAIALSSPLLGFGIEVPPLKALAARVLDRVLPSMTMSNEIKYEDLTRDAEHLRTYKLDPLRHDKISPPLYLGMLRTIEFVRQNLHKVRTPILIQAAGKEKIVSLEAIQEVFPHLGSENKKLIVYEHSLHEIFNDLDRKKVFTDLDSFLYPVLHSEPGRM